jgi:pimeloyl-ACP methyl ester carboxylesterase
VKIIIDHNWEVGWQTLTGKTLSVEEFRRSAVLVDGKIASFYFFKELMYCILANILLIPGRFEKTFFNRIIENLFLYFSLASAGTGFDRAQVWTVGELINRFNMHAMFHATILALCQILGRPFLDEFDSISKVNDLTAPLLIIHGDQDNVIGLEHGKLLFSEASEPKYMHIIEGASHGDLYEHDAIKAVDSFIKRQR